MKFYAVAYKFQEDVYFDFARDEDTFDLKESCFLPTIEMAEQFIEEELSDEYVPVGITLESLHSNGTWTYSREKVERWDSI